MTVRAEGCEHSIRETLFEIGEWYRVQNWSTSTIDDLREKTDFAKAAYAHDPAYHSLDAVILHDRTFLSEPETFKKVVIDAARHELETCDCRCEACAEIQVNTPTQPDPFGMDHPTTVPKHPDCRITGPPTTPEGDLEAHRAMGYTREREHTMGSPFSTDEPPGSDAEDTTASLSDAAGGAESPPGVTDGADETMDDNKLQFSCDDASLIIAPDADEAAEAAEEHDIEVFDYEPPEGHGGMLAHGDFEVDNDPFTMGEMTVDAGDLITDAIEEHARQSAERAEEIAEAMDDADHHIEFDMTATGEEHFRDEADPGGPTRPRPERRDGDADRLEGDEAPVPDPEAGKPSDGAKAPDGGEASVVRMGQPDLDPLSDDDFWG